MSEILEPNYLFEVSWEVCNKVGGIHTVVSTKALTMVNKLSDRYITIGPDVHRDGPNDEFEEDQVLMRQWRQKLYNDGFRVRIGKWKIKGSPTTILIDFSSLLGMKDEVLKKLWEDYRVDSISGQWDYIEPVLFGYAAGKIIESYSKGFIKPGENIIAHFHEWMTASGGLYLKKEMPNIGTVFTTHATVMGRSIAGNGLELYGNLENFNVDELAQKFNVNAKHSMEKTSAEEYDCFATVSDITARECKYLLDVEPTIVTPNGFENDFVWQGKEFDQKRKDARETMIRVAETTMDMKYKSEPLIVCTSGRYEFRNKGLDIYVDSMAKLNTLSEKLGRKILSFIFVPAGNEGPREDLKAALEGKGTIDQSMIKNLTHYMSLSDWGPIGHRMKELGLMDDGNSNVQVIFVPSYLNGKDGIFNKHYYELLAGCDVSIFPSYYEPWGYTPLESVAFSVPTITTNLAGFGMWVAQHSADQMGVKVVIRDDKDYDEVVESITTTLEMFAGIDEQQMKLYRDSANKISSIALWKNLSSYYFKAYDIALQKAKERGSAIMYDGGSNHEQVSFLRQQLSVTHPTWTRVMVERAIPKRLEPLEEISKNLWWSWTMGATQLFEYIDPQMWKETGNNPIAMLDRLRLSRFQELEQDTKFLKKLDDVYAELQKYMNEKPDSCLPRVAYFSMEYGLHNSLKIYSGGLGILAGDYLKEASDKNVPMVAIGLLYRFGYFTQKLSSTGSQEVSYEAQNFHKLPITPVRDENGNWKSITVAFPGRDVIARIWRCDVGRTQLYLLDLDHELNHDDDRSITYHLYGGDWENRLKQEMILGIGGIRALKELGIESDIYHCNEGHAALIGVERIHNYVSEHNISFSEALELVRSSSLFTTHTPVPAGHDAFPETMIRQYMSHYPDRLKITWDQFMNLGKTNPNDSEEKFSMSFLACNMSQEVNGVSWLHGEVSKDILGGMWPGYLRDELHIGYVTNGVHFGTWTSPKLRPIYERAFGEEFNKLNYDKSCWKGIYKVDDQALWNARLQLKDKLIKTIKQRLSDPAQFRFDSPPKMIQTIESLKPDVLTIGFARRFATYKRAHLLFSDIERLNRIVNNPERPVQFIFAGKAHPNDKPGQDLIKRIVEVASLPQFTGKIMFLQNYDMDLARRMVQGVDIWLNTPTRPLEASGTSGEKAVMNGVLHFSVLDGWWVEGYREGAGWMLPLENTFEDPNFQNEMDAEMIYSIIEDEIAPLYYQRDEDNVPVEFVGAIKKSISEVASNFTTRRMISDYEERFYCVLHERHKEVTENNFALAREIAAWKRKVSKLWDKVNIVSVKQIDMTHNALKMGDSATIEIDVDINELNPEDIGVELLVSEQIIDSKVKLIAKEDFELIRIEGSIIHYKRNITLDRTGSYDISLRVYAKNPKLPHRMDFALVKWA